MVWAGDLIQRRWYNCNFLLGRWQLLKMKFQKIVGAGWNLALAQPFGLNWMCYLAGKCQMALMIFSLFPSWDKTIQILVKAIGTVPVLVTYYFGFSWCVQWQSFSFTFWDEHENSFIQDVGWLIKNGWKSNRFL